MNLTEQGYYNLIVDVADPDELWDLFEPARSGEEVGVLEDVELALRFISERLDVDAFENPNSSDRDIESLMMKGYVLERIRFNILREEWEPVFSPFPENPLEYYDPDVTVVENHAHDNTFRGWVKLRQVPGELATSADPKTIFIHDSRYSGDRDEGFWINSLGIEVRGDSLKDVLDIFHDEVEEKFDPGVSKELEEKLTKFYEEVYMRFNGIE